MLVVAPEKGYAVKTLFLAVLLLIACASRGMAACDPSTISGVSYDTDADSAVVSILGAPGSSTEGFDYHAGRFFGHSNGNGCFEVVNVGGSDTYRILGAPPIVLIPIRIELRIQMRSLGPGAFTSCGSGSCTAHYHGGCSASMHGPNGERDSLSICYCGETTRSLGLYFVVAPGAEFKVRYYVGESVGIGFDPLPGAVEATIHFTGVPPGAQLVSCHGVNEEAVAVMPTTWGHLKATYR